jgi:hypothetical protein
MVVRRAGSPPPNRAYCFLEVLERPGCLKAASGSAGGRHMHSLMLADRGSHWPGSQGADTKLVRSEKCPLAAAKMPPTSVRDTGPLSVASSAGIRALGSAGPGGSGERRTSRGAANEPGLGG